MPTYDYMCQDGCPDFTSVQRMADHSKADCPKCGLACRQIPPPPGYGPAVSTFRGGWFRDIASQPLYIETPQELRNACDANNSYSHQLEDSIYKTSPGPDPTPDTSPECFGGGDSGNADNSQGQAAQD